jgi:hypothetical protein
MELPSHAASGELVACAIKRIAASTEHIPMQIVRDRCLILMFVEDSFRSGRGFGLSLLGPLSGLSHVGRSGRRDLDMRARQAMKNCRTIIKFPSHKNLELDGGGVSLDALTFQSGLKSHWFYP